MKLKDKTVLITGASSGIGKAVAIRVAKDGATVILASRNEDKLEKVKQEVEKNGGTGIVIKTDVTKTDNVRELFLKATEGGRVIDVVFNNAGLGFIGKIFELKAEDIETIVDVNVKGMIMVSKFASEIMVRQEHGHIIHCSSMAGLVTLPEWSVYTASKWGITAFSDCIRQELKPHNVRVSTLHPGAVQTEFFDKDKANIDISKLGGDIITSEDVAEGVYDMMLTDKRRLLIPQMVKNYSLMYKFMPGLVENMVAKMAEKIEYHEKVEEDEPEFSYIKSVVGKEE